MRSILAGLVFSLGLATSAQASVIFTMGNVGNIGDNVLLDRGETGSVLLGDLNNGLTNAISFSSTETLTASASGQAAIAAQDGTLSSLVLTPTSPNTGFTAAQFNIQTSRQAVGGSVTLTAFDQFGTAFPTGGAMVTIGNGQNRFTFQAIDNQIITMITIAAAAGVSFSDVVQVRIGGLVPGVPGVPGGGMAVPGPVAGAGLPALLALGGLVWARRRRAGTDS
jgi:hypothetical protein